MFMEEDVFVPAGVTDNQLPPSVVVTLVENETAAYVGEGTVVNETFCDKGVVDPSGAEGVQAVGLGVTVGGPGLPIAVRLAPPRLKVPTVPSKSKVIVPEMRETVAGMAAGTAVIMNPSGIVMLPEI
jgi:hypothetical protein